MSSLKKFYFFIAISLLFVPAIVWSCGQLNSTKPVPDGFGASYDLILPGYSSLIKVDCAAPSAKVVVGNGASTQYVYKKGYYYRNNAWQEFTFDNAVAGNDWIIGTANLSLTLTEAEKTGTNYIVAYICTWTGDQWKCGCRDKACANNFWQLQTFKYSNQTCADSDGDSYDSCAVGANGDDGKAIDCDDSKSSIYPGAMEVCDSFDNDCNGQIDEGCDSDGDTFCDSGMKLYGSNSMCPGTLFKGEGTSGSDCDDTNANINPGSTEVCDGVDNDCDKNTDEGCTCTDYDKDGYDTCGTGEMGDDGKPEDCNDKSWDRYPGAVEVCDGVDNDCDGVIDESGVCCNDGDSDSYDTCALGSEGDDGKVFDCDDANQYKNPGAMETCDNIDNNCNGKIDELCDEDNDEYCSNKMKIYNLPVSICPKTNVSGGSNGNDCNDSDYNLNPGMIEKCDGADNDCDGTVDENCSCVNGKTQSCGVDTGACQSGTQTCSNGFWGECVGEIKAIAEVCGDKIDNDCDGIADENCSTCADNDNDGYDNCAIGASGDDGKAIDCNDNEQWANPGGTETCDSVDNNCNGQTDEGCDDDKDGYCDSAKQLYGSNSMCKSTVYTVNGMSGDDCNDTNININPGKAEICDNGIDDNCQNGVDDGCAASGMSVVISEPVSDYAFYKNGAYFSYLAINGKEPIKYTLESNIDGTIYEGYEKYYYQTGISIGDHNIKVTAKDAKNKTVSASKSLKVYGDSDFIVPIFEPRNGKKFFYGEGVYFAAEGGGVANTYNIQWTSSLDGLIASSNYVNLSNLSLGAHKISLKVTNNSNQVYEEQTFIEIVNTPFLELTLFNHSLEQGDNAYMSANFHANSRGVTYDVSSSIDGFLGNDMYFSTSGMSVGYHTITVTANGDKGETATATVNLEVRAPKCYDSDGDGYGIVASLACVSGISDCNDNNKNINPGAIENCTNGIDDDCDGFIDDCAVTVEMQLPEKDDIVIERGSKVTIRAKAVGALHVSAKIQSPDGQQLSSVNLYDDGKHNDLLADDGVWAATWLAGGASTDRYYIDISLLRSGNNSYEVANNARTFFLSEPPNCGFAHNAGNSSDKLDILLVPDQFEESELPIFYEKAQKISEMLFSIEPFKAQQSKINIGWVEVAQNLGCDQSANGCSYANIIASAASCPWDEIVLLADSSFRSWATFGGYAMVSAVSSNYDWVVVHELGHSFASLRDEYIESGRTTSKAIIDNSVNCDSSPTCSKWSGVSGAGCFDGCDYNYGYYRSINSGLMRASNAKDLGPVNIKHVTTLLQKYQ